MNHMSQRFKDDRKGGSQVVINLVGRISHFCNSWSVEWLLRSWLTLAAGNLHLLYSWELFNLIWSFCPDTHSAGCCSFGLPLLLLWIFWIMGLLIWFPGDSFMSEWVNYGWIKNYWWSKSLLAVFGSHWSHKKKQWSMLFLSQLLLTIPEFISEPILSESLGHIIFTSWWVSLCDTDPLLSIFVSSSLQSSIHSPV